MLGNCVTALTVLGIVVPLACFLLREPVLYLFGASDATYPYANEYITIYLMGSLPVMLTLGLNTFINAQGFTRDGMVTVGIGALCNIVLDPIFIFGMDMGVQGAALATIIAQAVSAVWVLAFLTGKRTGLKIRAKYLRLKPSILLPVMSIGVSPFIMQSTESLVNIAFNASLLQYGAG